VNDGKVTCIKCNHTYISLGAHVQSFGDVAQYVCLHCKAARRGTDEESD